MADGSITLLRDANLRHRLGMAARLRALILFTVDGAITRFGEIGFGHMLPAAPPEPEANHAELPGLIEELAI